MKNRACLTLLPLLLAGCGGGGGGTSPTPSPPPPPPVTNATVTLSASAAEVSSGGNVTLTWSASGASSCTASQGWTGGKATSGTEVLGPIGAATTFSLSCSGSNGGTSDAKSVSVTPLLITSAKSKAGPLESITLNVNAPGATVPGASPAFTVQMDASGLATFLPDNVVEVAGLFSSNTLTLAAPILEAYQPVTPSSRFAIRVKRGAGNLTSNTLEFTYAAIVIPAANRGLPRAALETVHKYALMSNPETLAIGAKRGPGLLSDALRIMGNASPIADIEAEAILRQVYGISAMPPGTTQKMTMAGADGQARPAAIIPQRLRNAMDALVGCVRNNFEVFSSYEISAKICEIDDAAQIIRDDYIGGINDFSSSMSNVAGVLSAMLPRRLMQGVFGREIEHLAQSGAATQAATDFAQFSLSIPGVTATPDSTADYIVDRLTEYGKQKIHDKILERIGVSDAEQRLFEMVGSRDASDGAVAAFASGAQWFYNGILDLATTAMESLEKMRDQPELYGGDPLPAETLTDIPIPGGILPIDGTAQTPRAICAAYPEIGQGVMALGFASCLEYMEPFFDPKFLREVIQPIMGSWDLDALVACASTPDTPKCEALFAQLAQQLEDLFDTLREYGGDDFKCERSYLQFEARNGSRTCVFSELVVMPLGTSLPGSKFSNWDFGGQTVFIYFSRDFIGPGNTCKPNYALVEFLGTNRCRWENLPLNKPAAYSLNPETGEKQILEK